MKMFNISKVQKTIPWIESSSALFVLCLLFFLLFFPHDSARAESLRLEDLVQISLNRHPSLQALRSQKNAQKQRVVQAGAYANPMLQLGVMNLPEGRWKFGEDMMTARSVGIMQRVHFPGRLTLQREQAGEKLEQLLARIEELELKLTNRVEKTYFDLWYNRRAQQTVSEQMDRVEEINRIARMHYRVDRGIRAHVDRAESRLASLENKLVQLKRSGDNLQQRLARLTTIATEELIVYLPENLKQPDLPDIPDLQERMLNQSPALRGVTAGVEGAEKRKRLAELEYYPDFDIGVNYQERQVPERSDFLSVNVSVPLPVWYRSREGPGIEEGQQELNKAKAEKDDLMEELFFQLNDLHSKLSRLLQQVQIHDNTLVPRARSALSSYLSAYRVGEANFNEVVDAEVELLDFELARQRLLVDYRRAYSELKELVGDGEFNKNRGGKE